MIPPTPTGGSLGTGRPGLPSARTPRASRRLQSARVRRRAAAREILYVIGLLISAGTLYTALVLLPGRMRTDEMRQQRDALLQEVEQLERTVREVEQDTQALQQDPWVVERALRRRLGYLRPQERVLALVEAPPRPSDRGLPPDPHGAQAPR